MTGDDEAVGELARSICRCNYPCDTIGCRCVKFIRNQAAGLLHVLKITPAQAAALMSGEAKVVTFRTVQPRPFDFSDNTAPASEKDPPHDQSGTK